jgi:hypothetical protein
MKSRIARMDESHEYPKKLRLIQAWRRFLQGNFRFLQGTRSIPTRNRVNSYKESARVRQHFIPFANSYHV